MCVRVGVHVCIRAYVRACMRVCVHVCVRGTYVVVKTSSRVSYSVVSVSQGGVRGRGVCVCVCVRVFGDIRLVVGRMHRDVYCSFIPYCDCSFSVHPY